MGEGYLLVPSEWMTDLLTPGEHGSRPPYAFQWHGRWSTPDTHIPDEEMNWGGGDTAFNQPQALVLAWNGEPVAEGMDRLLRALKGRPKKHYTMRDVESASFSAKVEGIGTIVNIPVTP